MALEAAPKPRRERSASATAANSSASVRVLARRGLGAVPGPSSPVRDDSGQRAVCRGSLGPRSTLPGRRPQHRMPKREDPGAGDENLARLGQARAGLEALGGQGRKQRPRVLVAARCAQHSGPPRRRGQVTELVGVHLTQAVGNGQGRGQRRGARSLRPAEHPLAFAQRQRIASGLRHQPGHDIGGEAGPQQGSGGSRCQAFDGDDLEDRPAAPGAAARPGASSPRQRGHGRADGRRRPPPPRTPRPPTARRRPR